MQFKLKSDVKVGVIGPCGSGKSTLIQMLSEILEERGLNSIKTTQRELLAPSLMQIPKGFNLFLIDEVFNLEELLHIKDLLLIAIDTPKLNCVDITLELRKELYQFRELNTYLRTEFLYNLITHPKFKIELI